MFLWKPKQRMSQFSLTSINYTHSFTNYSQRWILDKSVHPSMIILVRACMHINTIYTYFIQSPPNLDQHMHRYSTEAIPKHFHLPQQLHHSNVMQSAVICPCHRKILHHLRRMSRPEETRQSPDYCIIKSICRSCKSWLNATQPNHFR